MKHKIETEEIKVMLMSGEVIDFVRDQLDGEETQRNAAIDRLSACYGKADFVFSDFMRASGAFDRNFFVNAMGFDVLTVKPSGTPLERADGLPRLRNCGLSLDLKGWLKCVAKSFETAANATICCTSLNAKIKKVRFKDCEPEKFPQLHFSIVAEKGEIEKYREEHFAQMKEWIYNNTFCDAPYRFYLRKWTNGESEGFFRFLLHDGGENVFEQIFRRNERYISDFYILEETDFRKYMDENIEAITREIKRLEKQAVDYVALMGEKYKKEAENGLENVKREISVEVLKDIQKRMLNAA